MRTKLCYKVRISTNLTETFILVRDAGGHIMHQEPAQIALNTGTHYICSCGQSKNLPYCDGSHQGTKLKPLVLELESPQTVEISDLPQSTELQSY